MIFEGKLLQTINGRTFFGEVVLEVELSKIFKIEINISKPLEDIEGIEESVEPAWVASALDGVNFAINEVRKKKEIDTKHIKIIKILGTVVDTTPGAIFCASVRAIAEVFALPSNFFVYDNNGDYSARVTDTNKMSFDD